MECGPLDKVYFTRNYRNSNLWLRKSPYSSYMNALCMFRQTSYLPLSIGEARIWPLSSVEVGFNRNRREVYYFDYKTMKVRFEEIEIPNNKEWDTTRVYLITLGYIGFVRTDWSCGTSGNIRQFLQSIPTSTVLSEMSGFESIPGRNMISFYLASGRNRSDQSRDVSSSSRWRIRTNSSLL